MVLGLVDVVAVVRVVVVCAAEVVGAPFAVVSGAEVAVGAADVVAGADAVGCGGSACREPFELLVLPTGAGLTSRYRVNTARKSRDSSRVEVRSLPFSSVAGSRPRITSHRIRLGASVGGITDALALEGHGHADPQLATHLELLAG